MITDDEHDCAEFGDKAEQVEKKIHCCNKALRDERDKYKFFNRLLIAFICLMAVVKLAAEVTQ